MVIKKTDGIFAYVLILDSSTYFTVPPFEHRILSLITFKNGKDFISGNHCYDCAFPYVLMEDWFCIIGIYKSSIHKAAKIERYR